MVGAVLSHGEGNEAVVSLDVPLEDLRAWPQHTLETRPVQLHTLERTTRDDGGRPGTVQQQSYFTWSKKIRDNGMTVVHGCSLITANEVTGIIQECALTVKFGNKMLNEIGLKVPSVTAHR